MITINNVNLVKQMLKAIENNEDIRFKRFLAEPSNLEKELYNGAVEALEKVIRIAEEIDKLTECQNTVTLSLEVAEVISDYTTNYM